MNYDVAFERVIGHEGGYVFDRRDPGGETKYGISKRAYPNVDIERLTLGEAKAIYRRDYWDRMQAEQLPGWMRFHVFDAAVNSGVKRAAQWLQEAVGAKPDGIIGAKTIAAARASQAGEFIARFSGARLMFVTTLPTWDTFGKGWTRRIAMNLKEAQEDA